MAASRNWAFQLLQMQEQMRQMQQDNEFRFQELEKTGNQRSDAGSGVTQPGIEQSSTASTTPDGQDSWCACDGPWHNPVQSEGRPDRRHHRAASAGSETASLSSPDDHVPGRLQPHADRRLCALAEQVFADYLASNPEAPRAADAMFWLGEAQYSQGRYQDSAKTFLDAHKQFPSADKGPDALLKLGMSLAKLDNRETACATLREVLIRYPGASAAVRAKVSEEQQLASC
jgi:tol-pal system protein YbgF